MPPIAQAELDRRLALWERLKSAGGPDNVPPSLVQSLELHVGEQGVFRDVKKLRSLGFADAAGVAVGVLHTGRRYSDDLCDQGLVYHYPQTMRRGTHDVNEVHALKTCRALGLPLFVIIKPQPNSRFRHVRLGWIVNYIDPAGLFLIRFGDHLEGALSSPEPHLQPFALKKRRPGRPIVILSRPDQWRFRFDVLQRYGTVCAACEVQLAELLDAAHVCPVEHGGTDDARNGLVFCANHHRAYDSGLFRIHPDTLQIRCRVSGPGHEELLITRSSILHLTALPAAEALKYAWESDPLSDTFNRAWDGSQPFGSGVLPLHVHPF